MGKMERFTVTRVEDECSEKSEDQPQKYSNEIAIDVNELKNIRRSSKTVPNFGIENRRISLAQLTREALPRLDNFRISKRALKRPSLGELHGESQKQEEAENEENNAASHHSHFKLGWIQGVLIPVLLNIYGVMLFLRMGWIVAQAGIIETFVIIGVSAFVCVITTLSLSAISTNGEVKGGGIYYIISRSLGPEFGASVGVVFAFANAVAASMNTIGFCDSLVGLLGTYDLKIVDGDINDIRIIGTIALIVMIFICAVGMEWEVKAQNVLIVIIVGAIIDFLVGSILGPSTTSDIAKGFSGFSFEVLESNMKSDYRFSEGLPQTFITVFAIFFPSVTGIQAGANISGDLKDPGKAIPKGTILALIISMTTYFIFVIFVGGAALRDGSGLVSDVVNHTAPYVFECVQNNTCIYGTHNSYAVMQQMSVFGGLIYAGCFAATLSTALTNLLSVPRLVQALGDDKIYPGVIFFSKGYGKNNEPYRGYILTFGISLVFLLIADLNAIAPLISNFYLAAYALINLCTFHAAFVKPLGWRPSFKFYNAWLSLFGFMVCVVIMFMLSWVSSLITLTIIFLLYLLVAYRKPDVNWGSSTQEQTYKTALSSALRLQRVNEHIKNYHPQVLVLSGNPSARPPLIDLANLITKHSSLLVVGDVIQHKLSYRARNNLIHESQKWLEARKVKAFYNLVDNIDLENGVRCLIQSSGLGRLAPNIVLMGYKSDWRQCSAKDINTYFNLLHNSFECRVGVAILSTPGGCDYSHYFPQYRPNSAAISHSQSRVNFTLGQSSEDLSFKPKEIMHNDSNLNLEGMVSSTDTITAQMTTTANRLKSQLSQYGDLHYVTRGGTCIPREILDGMNIFQDKQKKGTIDVWWLYDNGGLTILLPYIISTRAAWGNCKIRVFALTNRKQELEIEERNMANLLSKLRIDFSDLKMVHGVTDKPREETIMVHDKILKGFMENENDECYVSKTEYETNKEKTYRHLRLREMLMAHSMQANLVVMSLPMPRKESISAPLYLSWLDMLTLDMPPFLLVRGNQSSVLTFYS